MDLNNVTLEITGLIITFDHYDALAANLLSKEKSGLNDEFEKIRSKNSGHLRVFFGDTTFYDQDKQLKKLSEIKTAIKDRLEGVDAKKVHEFIERLEKDAKKMRKLYKALQK
ncbi:hypothetical protein ACEN9X_24765 [Mucilaginibacter sp. Mucisp86]|uniref:hypothetical protein n=1 Tax=Mucilaginibacter sp. Mucisp86 TaxID=3243060 RepID=UPI0039B5D0EF